MKLYRILKILGISCCIIGGTLGATVYSSGANTELGSRTNAEDTSQKLLDFMIDESRPEYGIFRKERVIVKEDAKGLVLEYTLCGIQDHPFPTFGVDELIRGLQVYNKTPRDIYKISVFRSEDDNDSHLRQLYLDYGVYYNKALKQYILNYAQYDPDLDHCFENVTELDIHIPVKTISNGEFTKNALNKITKIHHFTVSKECLGRGRYNTSSGMFSTEDWFRGLESLETVGKIEFEDDTFLGDMGSMFRDCKNLRSIGEIYFPKENLFFISGIFQNCPKLTDLPNLIIPNTVRYAEGVFSGCKSLERIPVTFEQGGEVPLSAREMFRNCSKIQELSGFKLPSRLSSGNFMFSGCTSLTKLPNIFSTEETEELMIISMFSGCHSLCEIEENFSLPANVYMADNLFKDTAITTIPRGFRILSRKKEIGAIFTVPDEQKYKILRLPDKVDKSLIEYSQNNQYISVDGQQVVFLQKYNIYDTQNKIKEEVGEIVPVHDTMDIGFALGINKENVDGNYRNYTTMYQRIKKPLSEMERKGYINFQYVLDERDSKNNNLIVENIEKFGKNTFLSVDFNEKLTYNQLKEKIERVFVSEGDWNAKDIYITGYDKRTVDINITTYNYQKGDYLNLAWLENNKDLMLDIGIDIVSLGKRQTPFCRPIIRIDRISNISNDLEKVSITNENYDEIEAMYYDGVERDDYYNFSKREQISIDPEMKSDIYKITYKAIEKHTLSEEVDGISEEIEHAKDIFIPVDFTPPTAYISDGILTVSDIDYDPKGSGIDKIILPNNKTVTVTHLKNGKYYDLTSINTSGKCIIYDKAGNMADCLYQPVTKNVSGAAIILEYNGEWTNESVEITAIIENANKINGVQLPNKNGITDISDIENKTISGTSIVFRHWVEQEGDNTISFIVELKEDDNERQVLANAHVKIDKTAPNCEIIYKENRHYLKAEDFLSGIHHIILPNGTIVEWTPFYEKIGYEMTEIGKYIVYDYANNVSTVTFSGVDSNYIMEENKLEVGEKDNFIAPIPLIVPTLEDKRYSDDKQHQENEQEKEQESEQEKGQKKEEVLDDSIKIEKNISKHNDRLEEKTKENQKKLKENVVENTNTLSEKVVHDKNNKEGMIIEYLKPNGEYGSIFIPMDKVYYLMSGKQLLGKDIGASDIECVYFIDKVRPVIIGVDGKHYQYVKSTYQHGKIKKVLVEPTMEIIRKTTVTQGKNTPRTGDVVWNNLYAILGSVVYIITRRRKK